MTLLLIVRPIVPLPPAPRKMPLPLLEPEPATPATPIWLPLTVPLSEVPETALNSVMALPSASRRVLLDALNVIAPAVENVRLPAPMMLFGWLFEPWLLWKTTSMVVPLWPVKLARSPAAPVNVEPVTVTFATVPLLRASTARLLPLSPALLVRPNVVLLIVSRFRVPLLLTTEKLRLRPPLMLEPDTAAAPPPASSSTPPARAAVSS